MEENYTSRPIIDILSEKLNRDICMDKDKYLYLDTFEEVEEEVLEEAEESYKIENIEAMRTAMNQAIKKHLDTTAQAQRYDNIMSARSYAGYENPFQEEAQGLAIWASNCWVKAGEMERSVLDGAEMPTVEEVIEMLPIYA